MLAHGFAEEEIKYGVQLTLFFLRHPPYADGGSDRALTAAAMRMRDHLVARRIGCRSNVLCCFLLSRHGAVTPLRILLFRVVFRIDARCDHAAQRGRWINAAFPEAVLADLDRADDDQEMVKGVPGRVEVVILLLRRMAEVGRKGFDK